MAVADARNAIFAPAIGARPRMVMRKRLPRSATGTVIFPDSSPLTFRKIRTPALPIFLASTILFEADVFRGLKSGHEVEPRRELFLILSSTVSASHQWQRACTVTHLQKPLHAG